MPFLRPMPIVTSSPATAIKTLPVPPIPTVDPEALASTIVVVPVYNSLEVVRPCLEALHARTPLAVGIVVMDDCSDFYVASQLDAMVVQMRADGRPCTIEHNGQNLRYTRTINRGLTRAFGPRFPDLGRADDDRARFAVTLNSDTMVVPGWLEGLLAVVAKAQATGRRVASVCPYMTNGANLTLAIPPGSTYLNLAERARALSPAGAEAVTPIGACMLITREAWAELGPFDEAVSPEGYGEECDFWARGVSQTAADERKGFTWDFLIATRVVIYHQSHASFGNSANRREREAVEKFKARWGGVFDRHYRDSLKVDPLPRLRQEVVVVRPAGDDRPRVAFYVNGIVLCGGILALVNICNRLVERGIDATLVYTRDDFGDLARMPMRFTPICMVESDISTWLDRGGFRDGLVVATSWATAEFVRALTKRYGLKAGAFIQDREDMFRMADGRMQYTRGSQIEPYLELAREWSVVNSNWVQDSIKRDFGFSPTHYIPIGVDPDLFYPAERADDGVVRILSFSRPSTPRRGYALLAALYRAAAGAFGRRVELYTYDQTPGPDVPCVHLGKLPQRKLAEWMRRCDILVEPSQFQGWGMPGQEMMASGGAVLSTDNGGVHNYGVHDVNCLIAEGKLSEMFAALHLLVNDRALRQRLGAQARQDALGITWDKVADAWASVLRTR